MAKEQSQFPFEPSTLWKRNGAAEQSNLLRVTLLLLCILVPYPRARGEATITNKGVQGPTTLDLKACVEACGRVNLVLISV